MKQALVKRIQE